MHNSKEQKLRPIRINNRIVTLQNEGEGDEMNRVRCSAHIESMNIIIQGERRNDKKKTNRNARVVLKNCLTGETQGNYCGL